MLSLSEYKEGIIPLSLWKFRLAKQLVPSLLIMEATVLLTWLDFQKSLTLQFNSMIESNLKRFANQE